MRDHSLLTPQKEHHQFAAGNRRTKSSPGQSKKPHKITKKCLDSVFLPVWEENLLESPKNPIDISSIFQVPDDSQLSESAQNFVPSPGPAVSSSDLSQLSSTITSDDNSVDSGTAESNIAVKRGSIKADLVAKQFRQVGIQGSNSRDMVLLSKSVLDALLKIVIEELYDLPEEQGWFAKIFEKQVSLVLRKVLRVTLTLMLLVLAFAAVFFFSSGGPHSFGEPLPT